MDDSIPYADVSLITHISASSVLKGGQFGAANLVDQKQSSWCEGSKGDGTGETITILFKERVNIPNLLIENGFHDEKHWKANHRIKSIQIASFTNNERDKVLEFDLEDMRDIEIHPRLSGDKLQLRILSVHVGERDNDACIGEIRFDAKSTTKPPKSGETSCLLDMNWSAFSAMGKQNPTWFDKFCLNIGEAECSGNMGYEFDSSKSCSDRGYNHTCNYLSEKYLIKEASSCPL